jgi:hypothetical protein
VIALTFVVVALAAAVVMVAALTSPWREDGE